MSHRCRLGVAGMLACALLMNGRATAQGNTSQAWAAWTAQPASVAHFREGVALAASTGEISRGLTIYQNLITALGKTDPAAGADLALGAAELLADGTDVGARLAACATLVSAKRNHAGCADLIRNTKSPDLDEQARIVYRLANSGVRPTTLEVFDTRLISGSASVDIARTMTRLPVGERLALLRRVFDDGDVTAQRAAVILLGDMQTPEATNLLRDLQQRQELAPELKTPLILALARHGDQAALATTARLLPTMGRDARDAVAALAAAGNRAGLTPDRVIETTEGPDRLRVAERFFDAAPEIATRAVMEALDSADGPFRLAALRTAGSLGLGAEMRVLSCLTDRDPAIRSAAIDAALQTRDKTK